MQLSISDGVTERLSLFLERLGTHLWDSRQRASFAMYVLGLLSGLPNKSVEPIAALFATDPTETDAVYQRLLHFLGVAPWPDADVRHAATSFALAELQRRGPVQTLVIDDTSFPKKGSASVGVKRQYCGALGKVANCQVIVSLTAATEYAHLPIDMEPYLPKEWTDSQSLRERAHIPTEVTFQTKPDIALSLISRALKSGVPKAVVLADGAYGTVSDFRDGVRDLGLDYAVGIQLDTKVQLIRNEAECVSVKDLLARVGARPFRRYTWREGSKKALHARFAFFPVRIPKAKHNEPLWLMIERRDEAKEKDRAYLCSLPQNTHKKRLIYILKERWCTEAAYQESKGQLGMAQYQGRLYTGLQHHLSSVICTYAFIVAERERQERNGNPGKGLMVRTAEIPQRHSPTSIATLRKRIANAVTPWFLAAFPTRPRRQNTKAGTDEAAPLANGTCG